MTLDGMPPRMLGAEVGMESLFRRALVPATTGNDEPPSTLVADMRAMVNGIPLADSLKEPLLRALDGDLAARELLNGVGQWQMARLGMTQDDKTWFGVVMDHGVEIEAAGREVDALVHARHFERLPDLVRSCPVLSPYMSPTAVRCVGAGMPEAAMTTAMAAGACEFLLSQVARVDVHASVDMDELPGRRFLELAPARAGDRCIPGRGFVGWMMQRYGAESLAELWEMAPSDEHGRRQVAYNALQGWHSGTTTPNRKKAEAFVGAIATSRGLHGDERQREWHLFDLQRWAAGRVEATLRLVKYLAAVQAAPGQPRFLELLEAEDPDEWCRRRYGFWVEHWGQRQAAG